MSSSTPIIWLPSYPKSGNTWMRFLLYNLIFGQPNTIRDLDQYVPDIHYCLPIEEYESVLTLCHSLSLPLFVKSHYTVDIHQTLSLPFLVNPVGFIYIVRDPLDVMMSSLTYSILTHAQDLSTLNPELFTSHDINPNEGVCRIFLDQFIQAQGYQKWIHKGFGDWVSHVSGWLDQGKTLPMLLVRYEDLLVNTFHEITRICHFLDYPADETLIQQAIDYSSFAKMKEMEEKTIQEKHPSIFYQPEYLAAHQAGFRFMNRGQMSIALDRLAPDLYSKAKRAFDPLRTQLGYN